MIDYEVPPYSIAVRSLGKGGVRYRRLLQSISHLEPQPTEVVIAIPEGYDYPDDRLGWERFVHCKRGMVRQRIACGEAAICDLVLFLDDDLEFAPELVKRLYGPLAEGLSRIAFPIMFETLLPLPGIRTVVPALLGAAVPMLFGREKYYVKILANGGWSYNRFGKDHQQYYLSHSAPGACFLVAKEDFHSIELASEIWLEKPGYALLDDQVMFYKFHCRGMTAVGVTDIAMVHLDSGKSEPGRRLRAKYARSMNLLIFWHRFLFLASNSIGRKIYRAMCLTYTMVLELILNTVLSCARRSPEELSASVRGLRDGLSFLRSSAYRSLPRLS